MKNKIRLFLNPLLFIESLIIFPILPIFFLVIFYNIYQLNGGLDTNLWILFVVMESFGIFSIFYVLMNTGTNIVLSEEGVELHRGFKKTVFHCWDDYRYCEKGYYLYYGKFPSYYIVISTYKLRTCELLKINSISISEKVIKVKYNKKSIDSFLRILPPRLSEPLKNQFKNIKPPKINFIPWHSKSPSFSRGFVFCLLSPESKQELS